VAQSAYGAYDVNSNPSDFQLTYPVYLSVSYNILDGDVYFIDRSNERAVGSLFEANVTLPVGSTLSQGSGGREIHALLII
jgi:hypothetical protein